MDAHVSDLFFNYSHDEVATLIETAHRNNTSADDGALKAAILNDAQEFAAGVEGAFGVTLDPAELAADYWGRV